MWANKTDSYNRPIRMNSMPDNCSRLVVIFLEFYSYSCRHARELVIDDKLKHVLVTAIASLCERIEGGLIVFGSYHDYDGLDVGLYPPNSPSAG
jgi:hypothetical protein